MKRVKAVLILLMAVLSLYGQDITGSWTGSLTTPAGGLRVNFNITPMDNGYTSTLDSPDQNAYGIPVDSTLFNNPKITIKVSNLDILYIGTLGEEGTIKGTFKQMGQTLELDLTKKTE